MKHLLLVVSGCFIAFLSFAQLRPDSLNKTGKGSAPAERYKKQDPAKLPEGTYAKSNKVFIKQGYKGVYDANGKRVTIQRINSTGGKNPTAIEGGFSCSCYDGTDDCAISSGGGSLQCYSAGGKCTSCLLVITVGKQSAVMMSVSSTENSNMNWKNIEIPKMQQ